METPLPAVTRRQFGGWGISGNRSSVDAQGLGEISASLAGLSQTLRRGLASRKAGQSKEAESQREYGKHLYSASKIEFDKRLKYFEAEVNKGNLKPYQLEAIRVGGLEAQGIQLATQIYRPALMGDRGDNSVDDWIVQNREALQLQPQFKAILSNKYSTKAFEEQLAGYDEEFRKFNDSILKTAQQENTENAYVANTAETFRNWLDTPEQLRNQDFFEAVKHPSGIFKGSHLKVLQDGIISELITRAGSSGEYGSSREMGNTLDKVISLNMGEGFMFRGKDGVQKLREEAQASFELAEKETRDRNLNSLSILIASRWKDEGFLSRDAVQKLADQMVARGEISEGVANEWVHENFDEYKGVSSIVDGRDSDVIMAEVVTTIENGSPLTEELSKSLTQIKKIGGITASQLYGFLSKSAQNGVYDSWLNRGSNKELMDKFSNYFVSKKIGFVEEGITKVQGEYFELTGDTFEIFGKDQKFELELAQQEDIQNRAYKYVETKARNLLLEKVDEFKSGEHPEKTWKDYQYEVWEEMTDEWSNVKTKIGDRFVLDSLNPDQVFEIGRTKMTNVGVDKDKNTIYEAEVTEDVKKLFNWIVERKIRIDKTDLWAKFTEPQKRNISLYQDKVMGLQESKVK